MNVAFASLLVLGRSRSPKYELNESCNPCIRIVVIYVRIDTLCNAILAEDFIKKFQNENEKIPITKPPSCMKHIEWQVPCSSNRDKCMTVVTHIYYSDWSEQ